MKESHKRICAFAGTLGWAYIGCALVQLGLNPLEWSEPARLTFVLMAPLFLWMAACPIFDEDHP